MKSAPLLIDKVKKHEAFREFAYPDPASPLARQCRARGFKLKWGFEPAAGIIAKLPEDLKQLHGNPWTCGYGETKGVNFDTRWSKDEAHRRLLVRLQEFEDEVLSVCTVEPNPYECAALTSLNYNIGLGNLKKSTVLRAHNRGDKVAAANAFKLWDKAGKPPQPLPGLTRRRAEEAALYLRPYADATEDEELVAEVMEPISQVVEPERPMSQSQITRAGVLAGGSATVATVAETLSTVNHVKDGVEGLGQWLVPILMIVAIGAIGWAVYERYNQRKKGWA
jgi:GH24 family phage-related lysozyme (muramidase)